MGLRGWAMGLSSRRGSWAGFLGILGMAFLLASREAGRRGHPLLLRVPLAFPGGEGFGAGFLVRVEGRHVLYLELKRREAPTVVATEENYWEAPPHEGAGLIDPSWRVIEGEREVGAGSWRDNGLRLASGGAMAFGAFHARKGAELWVAVQPGDRLDLLEAAGPVLEVRAADEVSLARLKAAEGVLAAAGAGCLGAAAWIFLAVLKQRLR